MKISPFKTQTVLFPRFILPLAIIMCLSSTTLLADDLKEAPRKTDDENRIQITADRLITDTKEKNAEFIGNVKATQGTTIITSNRLKVFYRQNADNETQNKPQTDAITRILAEGNVKIVFDEQIAMADRADYLAEKKIVVLTGPDSKIIQGDNTISGSKITFYRDDGRIHVEGGEGERVEAVFYSEENNLVSPKKTK